MPQLQPLLDLQKQTGLHQVTLNMHTTEIHSIHMPEQSDVSVDSSPPMFSAHYVAQFLAALRNPMSIKLDAIVQADQAFIARQGWIMLLQGIRCLHPHEFRFLRNRHELADSERWQFVARRPIATGLSCSV